MSQAHYPHQPSHGSSQSIRSGPVQIPAKAVPIDDEPLELEPEPEGGDALEPLSLVERGPEEAPVSSKIKAFGVAGSSRSNQTWKRHTKALGTGAIRVRSFHGKLSEQGLDFMDNQINEWLDNHPEIEIKQVTTAIGQFEGKIREPALVVNIWY